MRAVITVTGKDKVGIIAMASAECAKYGVNIVDISQTVMKDYFAMIMLVELDGVENIKVIAVGGILSRNQSFVGTMAEKAIEDNYFAGKMFFSGKGVTSAGILESNEQECGIKKKMLKNSSTTLIKFIINSSTSVIFILQKNITY